MIFVSGVPAHIWISANVNYFWKDNKVEDLQLKKQWRLNLIMFQDGSFHSWFVSGIIWHQDLLLGRGQSRKNVSAK